MRPDLATGDLECSDAKTAFLQAEHRIGSARAYAIAIHEVSRALHGHRSTAIEVVRAVYRVDAPRVLWLDADHGCSEKVVNPGGPHGDRCLWTFKNRHGQVCGRMGAHADDFLIMGNLSNLRVRERIKQMYGWSPFKK